MEAEKKEKIFRMQPILCPWITSQPYFSSGRPRSKPCAAGAPCSPHLLDRPWVKRQSHKALPSIQQSSSQFFYFLRLMQLFPDAHPATLHTVLALCKNDFYCAVDKMLYARKCKLLCCKKNVRRPPVQRARTGARAEIAPLENTSDEQSSAGEKLNQKPRIFFGVNQRQVNLPQANTFFEEAQDLSKKALN